MNLLECYVGEVISTRFIGALSGSKEENQNYIEVEMIIDCWGNKEKVKKVFKYETWKEILKTGYYYA